MIELKNVKRAAWNYSDDFPKKSYVVTDNKEKETERNEHLGLDGAL